MAAACAALFAAGHSASAQVTWDGNAAPTPGDGFLWTNPLNWSGDAVPDPFQDLTFANPAATVGIIQLNGNQSANSLTFTVNDILGAYGTRSSLTNFSGQVSVSPGVTGTINANLSGTGGLFLFGGGTLYLGNPMNTFTGPITVDGAGTTLLFNNNIAYPQYSGVSATTVIARTDVPGLGFSPVRTVTLSSGGELKLIGAGINPDGGTKNISIGTGGGAINLSAGYVQMILDDVGQIANFGTDTLIKRGSGRLTITGALADNNFNATTNAGVSNPLQGDVLVENGILEFGRLQGGSTTGNTRFAGMTGTTSPNTVGTNTLTLNNGGTLLLNNGTIGNFDVATVIANNGSVLALQSNNQEIGVRTQGGATPSSTLQINGTVSILHRDLFTVQTGRNYFINSDLTGSGTLSILPSTQAGSASRVVIQRSVASTFDGIFRLQENANLEANPRFNSVASTGNVLAAGDIEFAGWGSTLDVRDSTATASVFDYTANEIMVTTTQAGAINIIAPGRSDAVTGTGNLFNFGTLTLGNHRIAIASNNNYQTGFADTANITGDASIEMRSDNSFLVFSNPAAISENAAGRSLTIYKTGVGNTAARDVISGGAISLSNLQVATGTLLLRGANGAITTGFGGAVPTVTVNGSGLPGNGNTLPTQGLLHLDNNTAQVVGTTTVFAGGNHVSNDRIVDSAILNMRGNSILRMTSLNNAQSIETIGTANVFGHGLFDIVKTGTATAPVALTLNTLNLGANATVNFTGTSLGIAGANTSRIVIPGTAAGFLGAQYHSGNEWAKYSNAADGGFELGVTPFVAADYTINPAEGALAAGQQTKYTSATGITLTGNRNTDRLNLQFSAANQSININGNVLSLNQGGLIAATNLSGITGAAGVGALTAGTTAPASLYIHNTATLEILLPITNNLGADGLVGGGDDQAVTFVKSGTGILILSHQSRTVGQAQVTNPFTATPWSSTNTGGWVVNDGMLNVHRGQFLGATPTTVTLNGGQLEINEPVSLANADTIIPGWGHNIVVNGNAMIGNDDNGEATDASTGDRSMVRLGSLAVNNGSILGLGAFSDNDVAFMGGAAFNGKATINIGTARSGVNSAFILNGVTSGSGFDLVAFGATPAVLVLGGTASDAANNTYDGAVTLYAGTLRLNKANGAVVITDGSAAEDVVINGGSLVWGPGHHGDLATTNNINVTNNALTGIAITSPAAIKNAGMNQIADTATVTLLVGSIGENDRINNDTWATLNQKSGTLNVGLGTMEVGTANISGGAFNLNNGGTFKAGTLNLLSGAYSPGVTTGRPGVPGAVSTLEVGAGGINLAGQSIILGSGSSGNVAGAGGVLKLGGNVNVGDDLLLGSSYAQTGIYVQTGNSFRELGNSQIDLLGGVRTFTIDEDVQYFVAAPITNGGLVKAGAGGLILQPYKASSFAGTLTVNNGVVSVRGNQALGLAGSGGTIVNNGGTLKLESGWIYDNEAFTLAGPGAIIPGSGNVREVGALVSVSGTNRITGTAAFSLSAAATIASDVLQNPTSAPVAPLFPFERSVLSIEVTGGITGTGTLTLSGNGDGLISAGLNTTTGGLDKDGSGRWIIGGASSYVGATQLFAGALEIRNGGALGSPGAGTQVYGGASLELAGGIAVSEPLTLNGIGSSSVSGALVSLNGANSVASAISLSTDSTIRSASGSLALGVITGANTNLTLSGNGNGTVSGAIATGGGGLTKAGTGSWTISGNNSFSGTTVINGGTLTVASAGLGLSSTAPVQIAGGNLTIAGAAQSVNGLELLSGGGTVNGGAGLSVSTITRTIGATAAFTGNVIAAGNTNTNGILGGYATVGTDWAQLNGSSAIVAFTAYSPFTSTVPTDNVSTSQFEVVTAPLTYNSLKLTGGRGINLGANGLTLTSGGLLSTNTQASAIGGTDPLTAGVINTDPGVGDLIVTVTGAPLEISAPINSGTSDGVTKTGSGTLILSGNSSFFGPIAINGGTLSVVGAGGAVQPPAFGSTSFKTISINNGTLQVVGGDYDPGAGNAQLVIGGGGATFRSQLGAQIIINDGPSQLVGPGDITFTGGARFLLSGGTPNFPNFAGSVTVDGGLLTVGSTTSVGGRAEQTITVRNNSVLVNNVGAGAGNLGLVNNLVLEDGSQLFAVGGNRIYSGDIRLSGTTTIGLTERDTPATDRQIALSGRLFGSSITLNVVGAANSAPLYLQSGSNEITGNINLGTNAVVEGRTPGSLGINTGDVTVNLNGINSRLLLRHFQDGDFRANVVVNQSSTEINSDRMANFGGGGSQYLGINNLTSNTNGILTFNGGNGYTTRVTGTATLTANTIVNTINGAGVLFDNGINFTAGATVLDKRGAASLVLHGPATHTGPTIVQGGFLILQGASGSLPNSSVIDMRGGELRIDNSSIANSNRLNVGAGSELRLGGGTVRVTGDVAGLPATVSAVSGTNTLVYNPASDTVASALTLNNFSRSLGAVVQFQASDYSGTVGATTLGSARVSPRFIIPSQATTTQTIPGFIGNNNLDFVQYDSATFDNGAILGVREMRNPGTVNSPNNYTDNPAETAWTDSLIARATTANGTINLSASRALDAYKIEAVTTVTLGANSLRIENGGILAVGNAGTITGTGTLTAGPATPGAGIAELFIGGNNVLNINSVIGNNGTQAVALVKTGSAATLNLGAAAANTYSGGTYITAGTLNTTVTNSLGSGTVFLNGGTLLLNVANTGGGLALGGFGQSISVNANSLIVLDNGNLAGLDNDYGFGGITINGPYTLGVRGFDSEDIAFSGTHVFSGNPTIDLPQIASGSNPNTTATATVVTINGAITGSGFFVSSSGATNDSAARLQIGGGGVDAVANTYSGKVTLLQGANNEDLFVELNKSAGTNAITGDLQLDGGKIIPNFDNQIADISNVTVNWGGIDFNGKNETIASLIQRGGFVRTNFDGTPVTNNTVRITGNYEATGIDDFNAVANSNFTANGLDIGSNSTLIVEGTLRLNGFSRAVLGASNANLILGGLEMTGTTLTQSAGAGANIVRLNGDVVINPDVNVASLGNSGDSDTFLELNGTRTFTVADGTAGIDLAVSTVIRNSTAPVAVGGFVKNGPGVMQLQGGGTANSYTGATAINDGTVMLFKNIGVNALGTGAAGVTVGDGAGAAGSAQLIIRNSNQIADTQAVILNSDGLLDLDTFNASETIGDLSGVIGSAIDLGPTSTLTVTSTGTTTFSGSIDGGTLVKQGAGTLTLNGALSAWAVTANNGTLNLDSADINAVVTANGPSIINLDVSQTLASLNIGSGGMVVLGTSSGAFPEFVNISEMTDGGPLGSDFVQPVPEPGSVGLLLTGLLGLLGRRQQKK